MPTPKNTHAKHVKTKTPAKATTADQLTDSEDIIVPKLTKNKRPAELEIPEDIVPVLEEKIDVDQSVTEDDADDANSDEASLDDEELNPFGDKWEQ